jgi:hypothetical protein
MPWIIALALIAIVALIIVSFAVHFVFSPWLLVAVAIVLRFNQSYAWGPIAGVCMLSAM